MADLNKLQRVLEDMSLHRDEAEDQLIIGLDFGTTFSGIAYAFTQEENPTAHSITDWPGLEGHSQPKVPTVISYNPADKTQFVWGGEKSKWPTIEAVKLLLDPDQEPPYYLPGAKNNQAQLRKLGKTAVEVAADYIGAIYRHALSRIEAAVPKQYFAQCQKKFVISVPAVWSDKAKSATERAAKKAGIHPVTMIKEPEAAALYTLYTQERALSPGDAFVICDAGGGTVDLISYEIQSTVPRLEVGELVPSKGGMAGSLGLNKRFEAAVEDLVGKKQFVTLQESVGFEKAMIEFDRSIKTGFRGDEDDDQFVNFPMAKLEDDPDNNLVSNCWHMKGKDVLKIFDPLITHICDMVREQVDKVQVKRLAGDHSNKESVKAIFLVGGFGSSLYLKARLQALFEDIQVIQPVDAWSAIVKGAVLSQLPRQAAVRTMVAMKHFGVSAMSTYDEERDEGQEKFWKASEGKYRVETMNWYILQGEDLVRDHKEIYSFYRTLQDNYVPDDLIFNNKMTESDALKPPVHPKVGLTKTSVNLKVDLRDIDKKHFKRRQGADGNAYWDLYYDLAMTIGPALLEFSLEIDGVTLGRIESSYS